eukprot:COSAG05_NODE_25064_length_198_cov_49.707071_1_plen_58_part_10
MRLVLQARQRNVDMVPLMLQAKYSAYGWLGILLGSGLWHRFYGSVLESEAEFEEEIHE